VTDPTITNAAQAALGDVLSTAAHLARTSFVAVNDPELGDQTHTNVLACATRLKAAHDVLRDALAVPVVEETSGRVLWEGPLGAMSRAWQGYGNGESDRPEDRVRVVRATDQPTKRQPFAYDPEAGRYCCTVCDQWSDEDEGDETIEHLDQCEWATDQPTPTDQAAVAMGLCSRCHVSACRSEGRLPDLCVACFADVARSADQPTEVAGDE
jgi:hypothetical protein